MKQALPHRRTLVAISSAIALVCMIAGAGASPAVASEPGAIHLLTQGCEGQGEVTHFDSKQDVYVIGSHLTQGTYSLVVTSPEGTPLGQSPIPNVTVGANGVLPCTQIWSVVNKASDSNAQGFDDTDNNGGEYQVNLADATDDPKSKNFKAPGDDCGQNCDVSEQTLLHVRKFYDANLNGKHDLGEPKITGWEVQATNVTDLFSDVTDWDILLDDGTWMVSENAPVEPNWFATTATSELITIPPETTVDFGNACTGTGPGGGLTLGFWSNKNGQALITNADITFLDGLNLRNANGSAFDPGNKTDVKNWLLKATATNMAYMLSAQLATMELNVRHGLDGNTLIYVPGALGKDSFGYISINGLMAEANVSLGLNGNTVAAGALRTYQEVLKNALDAANNNNITFIEPTPCDFTFPTA